MASLKRLQIPPNRMARTMNMDRIRRTTRMMMRYQIH